MRIKRERKKTELKTSRGRSLARRARHFRMAGGAVGRARLLHARTLAAFVLPRFSRSGALENRVRRFRGPSSRDRPRCSPGAQRLSKLGPRPYHDVREASDARQPTYGRASGCLCGEIVAWMRARPCRTCRPPTPRCTLSFVANEADVYGNDDSALFVAAVAVAAS